MSEGTQAEVTHVQAEWKPGATKRLGDSQWSWMADNSGPDKRWTEQLFMV